MKVLDLGYVNLVDSMGDDNRIEAAARVSYAGDKEVRETHETEKLLRYLWKNHHTSPFEHGVLTFEVKAPLFVLRQWHRHRTWAYNEVSARYTELPEEFYTPTEDSIGVQSTKNKQVRDRSQYAEKATLLKEFYASACRSSVADYKQLLEYGMPRELARAVLPGAVYSRMYATVNLLNLLKFISLRDHEHAQFEIQEYARAMKVLISDVFPITMKVYDETVRS